MQTWSCDYIIDFALPQSARQIRPIRFGIGKLRSYLRSYAVRLTKTAITTALMQIATAISA